MLGWKYRINHLSNRFESDAKIWVRFGTRDDILTAPENLSGATRIVEDGKQYEGTRAVHGEQICRRAIGAYVRRQGGRQEVCLNLLPLPL